MSSEITTAMVDTYNDGIEMLAQQMNSKLIDRVRLESDTGERVSFDQVGSVAVQKRTVRHADTAYINSPHRRRWVTMEDFDLADLLDRPDLVKILNNPSGAYSRAFVAAFNRQRDESILTAALGTAITGKTATGSTVLPAGTKIAAGAAGFTLAKVKTAMKLLKAGSAVDGNGEMVNIAWTSFQEEQFLDTTEVKSVDYNTQRVLMDGGMGDGKFYGFNYVRLEDWTDDVTSAVHRIVPYDLANTTRQCVAWVTDGILFNEPLPPRVLVDKLPGKRHSWQYFIDGSHGATRMQESKVIQIDCIE